MKIDFFFIDFANPDLQLATVDPNNKLTLKYLHKYLTKKMMSWSIKNDILVLVIFFTIFLWKAGA